MIYYTHINPAYAALSLGDNLLGPALEFAVQIMANVYYDERATYKPPIGPMGEPITLHLQGSPYAAWVKKEHRHWLWMVTYIYYLDFEYSSRLGHLHPLHDAVKYLISHHNSPYGWMGRGPWEDPPLFNRRSSDAIEDYREVYFSQKHYHIYKISNIPEWLMDKYKDEVKALMDKADLVIVDPDQHRPNGLTDSVWEDIVFRATEVLNGRLEFDE